jgi:protocatechuate 3,4-dioxygenase beta subunit
MRRVAIALVALLLAALRVEAQSPAALIPDGRVTLRGVVVDASIGAPVRRARVNLTSGRAPVGSALTDDAGRFSLDVASATSVSIRIVKAGYASTMIHVPVPRSVAADPLRIVLARGAVIAGRAVDASGEPATLVVVRRVPSGAAVWSPVGPDGIQLIDDLSTISPDNGGEFRIGGLVPGRYVIDAYPPGVAYTIGATTGFTFKAMVSPSQERAVPIPVSSVTVNLEPGAEATGIYLNVERMPSEPSPADLPGSTIRGTVTTTDGAPVADATVSVSRSGIGTPVSQTVWPGGRTARSDSFGQFALRGIDPGTVRVRASKRGYVQAEPGQRGGDLPGQTLTIEAGRDLDDLTIVMPRRGAISGTVVDESGEPLQEAAVQLVRAKRQPNGVLTGVREQGGYVRMSDDRGQFTLADVLPGDYAVMAFLPADIVDPAAAVRTAYPPAYYPDTPDFANASAIRIIDGENIAGLILTMRRVPVGRVTGVAHTSRGLPVTGSVRLVSRHAVTIGDLPRVARPGPDGEFAFADVPPGDYLLRTLVESGPSAREFASSAITVADGDPEPVMIRTSLGSTVSGRIVLEGCSGQVLWGYSATSVAVDSAASTGSVTNVSSPVSTGEPFTLSGLAGPTRVRVWSDDQSWYVKSIVIDGFDVTDAPFDFGSEARAYSEVEAVFSRGATITGRVTDDRAAPVRDYAAYVFATDRDKWFDGSRWVKLARASADGTFTASSMPPGEYWIAAVNRVDASTAADTEVLAMLTSRASRMTVGEGQSQNLTLRLISR